MSEKERVAVGVNMDGEPILVTRRATEGKRQMVFAQLLIYPCSLEDDNVLDNFNNIVYQ